LPHQLPLLLLNKKKAPKDESKAKPAAKPPKEEKKPEPEPEDDLEGGVGDLFGGF